MWNNKLIMTKRKLLMLTCVLLLATSQIFSQVGINTEMPNKLSELEVTNLLNDQGEIVPKGVLIPRMTQEERDKIDVNDPDQANSLMVYNTDEDCYNYYSKADGDWQSVCGKMGKAKLKVLCNNIEPVGIYVEKSDLNSSNYLKIVIEVEKAGSYDITGTTTNGYFFTATGTFLDVGTFTIYATGQGTPKLVQADLVTISNYGTETGCTATINVASAVAEYSLNCSSVAVAGQYLKGTALTAANTISMNVNVSKPGSYNISTPVTNGISFVANGTFTSTGMQAITLYGIGTPTVNIDFPITINANTPQGNNTCSAIIPVTLPAMTYAVIGSGDYSWASSHRKNALTNGGVSFGPNGLVRIIKFEELWSTSSVGTATSNLTGGGVQPDVVLYFAYGAAPTTALSTALSNYINKGGCVIYGSADNTEDAVNILMQGVFGMQTADGQITDGDDDVYPIILKPDDPVVNGPFGNLAGRYWGEDNASNGSVIMTQLPPNSVQICTAASAKKSTLTDPQYSIVWYNDSKNFLFIGDSVASSTSSTSSSGYPSLYSSDGMPKSKYYGPSSTTGQVVFNAALELNAVSWAIKKAATSGINPH